MDASKSDLPKEYDPASFEGRWYQFWLDHDLFRAGQRLEARPFTIVIPPPNITGKLHFGHALNNTLQDILVRRKRMQGFDALWLPGTDHAGIATQMVVERDLRSRGISRHDLGREKFVEEVWRWREKHGGEILATLKKLGASCDFSRTRFTLDEGLSRAVREVFVSLYEDGLIYRSEDLINWCPSCRTALSDLEVEVEEGARGNLWEIAYPLADGSGRLVVATTRPETMLGDTAVAVHPEDARYSHLIGKEVALPLVGRRIPVIGDAILVDPAFGTGVVKVTPGHDFNDFETGKRHRLPLISVMDEGARINEKGGRYAGLDRFEARKKILADLEAQGLLVGSKEHTLPLRRCDRCDTIVEPFFSWQWFVKMESLARPALEVVRNGGVEFVPEAWKKTYYEWMTKIHDWCISRQLWWGHRIPAWYCADGHMTVARETPSACATCSKKELRQEEDVLDTWFSSALWPFSTLGWPDDTPDLRRYYPTSVLSTGPDIIFFWVARMIMMGLRFRKDIPFSRVYFNGLVRDAKGQKMSKTKGNVIDPDGMITEYGADPIRFTLAILASPGSDIPVARERIDGYRAFANKLWNATRFVLMNLEDGSGGASAGAGGAGKARAAIDAASLAPVDRWILGGLETLAREVDADLEQFRFDLAANRIYHYIWHEFCDWYIEWVKPDLLGGRPRPAGDGDGAPPPPQSSEAAARTRVVRSVLAEVLDGVLRLLHPFMPHLTEELWQKIDPAADVPVLADGARSIAVAPFPKGDRPFGDAKANEEIDAIIGLVQTVRNLRAESGIDPARRIRLVVTPHGKRDAEIVERHRGALATLARCGEIATDGAGAIGPAARGVTDRFEVAIPLEGLLDIEAESKRLRKERERLEKEIGTRRRKLSDASFLERAPAAVVEKEKSIHAELSEKLGRIDKILAGLSG
jgi:valyl-tRNA synthetase